MEALPTFIYSYVQQTNQLWRTDLLTGEQSCHKVRSYSFTPGCSWSELPGGNLLILGGYSEDMEEKREVVRIDTLREFAVTTQPRMFTARVYHCAVYHSPHLYILGGAYSESYLAECERFALVEKRWEILPSLPQACCDVSGVVSEGSLYALGGHEKGLNLDLIQRLRLDRLTWEVMQFRLPSACNSIVCFQHNNQVYFILKQTLYSLTPLQALRTLPEDFYRSYGSSYYSRGTLYCANDQGAARRWKIRRLN
jgi:hypothetical protein